MTASQPLPLAELPPAEQEEKVAEALWTEGLGPSLFGRKPWAELSPATHRIYRRLAAAAIAVMPVSPAAEAHARIVSQATDLCWKATPFTEDETGAIAAYLLPAGVVHRLLGALQGAGYSAAFRAIAAPQTGEHTADEESDRER